MKGSEFAVEIVNLLHYKHHKISLNRAESYVDCFKGLKNLKKKTRAPKNNDYKYLNMQQSWH